MQDVIDKLLNSDEPSVRYKVMVQVLGYDKESARSASTQWAPTHFR